MIFGRLSAVMVLAALLGLMACFIEYIYLLVTLASVIFFGISDAIGR